MVLFDVSNAVFPVEMYKHLQTFKKSFFFQRLRDVLWPWNFWGKRILFWEVLLSWWALWSGRHCILDCCNEKIWVLFSVLLLCSFSLPCVIVWANCFQMGGLVWFKLSSSTFPPQSFPPYPNLQSLSDVRYLHFEECKDPPIVGSPACV